MKRYLYIIIGIVVVAAVAIGVLLYIKNGSSGQNGTGPSTNTSGSLPVTGTQGTNGGTGTGVGNSSSTVIIPTAGNNSTTSQASAPAFGVISNNPVIAYTVSAQDIVTAIDPSGDVFAVRGGTSAPVNSSTINNIFAGSFSFDGKKAIVSAGDPNAPQTSLYDVTTNTWVPLPNGMLSPQWSPSSYQIAYLAATSGGGLALKVLDATNAASIKRGPSTLVTLAAVDLSLQWPMKNYFILSDKPTAQSAGSVWMFNSSAGTLTPIASQVPGAESAWSNNATTPYGLMFSANANGGGGTLALLPLYGSAPHQQLSFLTLPSKCAFDNETLPAAGTSTKPVPYLALYCGVPRDASGFAAATLPDDYAMTKLFTSDNIFKINTASGALTSLWSDQTQNIDISNATVRNGTLFFVNRYDQKLYGLTNVVSQ